jgi:hypothetical protein
LSARVAPTVRITRLRNAALALSIGAGVALTPVATILDATPASAQAGSTVTYTATAPPKLATITNGTSAAPWNSSQGDPGAPEYTSQAPGTLLPTYTPGGATTSTGGTVEPNLAVYPTPSSSTPGTSPYPSGVVGTPGPLDGYCGTGNQATETTGTPARQPGGTTLPLAPAYFPHIVRNADGSLTGYFDYRPKDTDEAIVVAKSTDGGYSWIYEGEAFEQNPGLCPSGDTNDDGEGHPNVIAVNGVSRLYTLQRAAGDDLGVGLLVHNLTPTTTDPLAGQPAVEQSGIDPDAIDTDAAAFTVTSTSNSTITLNTTGQAGTLEQLLAGGFVDLTATPTPNASDVITCGAVTTSTLTGCNAPSGATVSITPGDLIEQVIGYVGGATTIPAGPNNSAGTAGTTVNVLASPNGSAGFTNALTGAQYVANAPNRAYIDGVAVYCVNGTASTMTFCSTGSGASPVSLSANANDPITSDPIVPKTATQTSGLVAPDGIVGTLPAFPGVPTGYTAFMYTEKILNYYVAGTIGSTGSFTSSGTGSHASISFTPSPTESMDMPATVSPGSPVTVYIGDTTKVQIDPVTCTGLTTGSTDTLTGCSVPTADNGDAYHSNSLIGSPGAAVVPYQTLQLTGEGPKGGIGATPSNGNIENLMKNNEDLSLLRVAYTNDGINFSDANLANNGIISGNGTENGSSYNDINNPSTTANPTTQGGTIDLNEYATPGTPDATEMRWVGSTGAIITNPDGSLGMFLNGAWAADGDSDAFNQIFYASSTDGGLQWSVPTTVVSTDYTFAASVAQDAALASGADAPLGISGYYSGRAYGPTVVQNPNGTLTLVFAGYRLPKPITNTGTTIGTGYGGAPTYTIGTTDPALYRNILTMTLDSSTSPAVGTATAVTSSPANPVVGQPVSLTATVSVPSPGAGTPTGTVAFTDNGGNSSLCTATLDESSPDTATCTYTDTAPETDSVTGAYSGDSNYATSSGSTSVTVGQDATATTVSSSTDPAVVGQTITFSSTVSVPSPGAGTPTGTVAFTDNGGNTTLCSGTLSGSSPYTASCTTSYATTTTDSVTATYGGDTNDAGSSSSTLSQSVVADPTSSSFTFAPSAPVSGQTVTLTDTVAAAAPGAGTPTGTVAFTDNGGNTTLCSGTLSATTTDTASCTTSYPGTTSDDVTASYGGDGNYGASSSSSTITVGQASTKTDISFSPDAPVVGQTVTFTSTVKAVSPGAGAPTGTVAFTDNGGNTTLCSGTLSATKPYTASCTTVYDAPGSDAVTATYSGDPNFFSSSSTTTTVDVGQDTTTTTASSSPPAPVVGQTVTLTGTVAISGPSAGIPTGTVTFTDNDGNTTLCSATLSANSPYVASCPTTYTAPVSDTVTATYGGDTNDATSSTTTTIDVGQDTTTTTASSSPPAPVVGQTVTLTGTVAISGPGAGIPTGTVTFTDNDGNTTLCSATLSESAPYSASCPTTYTAPVSDTVTATYGGDTNDATSSGTTTVDVGKDPTSTSLASSVDPAVSGQVVSFTATVGSTGPDAGPPNGSVTFAFAVPSGHGAAPTCKGGDKVTLSGGTAECTLTAGLPADQSPAVVSAKYSGSTAFAASRAPTYSESVDTADSSVTVTAKANPSVSGSAASFSATVAAVAPGSGHPTGTVTWTITSATGTNVPCATSNDTVNAKTGVVTCSVAAGELSAASGPYTVTVSYPGDANFSSSVGILTQSISKVGSKTTLANGPYTTSTAPSSVTATVDGVPTTAGDPTGTVTFSVTGKSGATVQCVGGDTQTLHSQQATCTFAMPLQESGSPYAVVGTYSGDGNFDTSVSKTHEIPVR